MKTTFDIADNILARSRSFARRRGVSLKELVEEGLELALERREKLVSKKIKPVTFKGNGKNPEFQSSSWSEIREEIYRGHGA